MSSKPRSVDDFSNIRARMDELKRDREAAELEKARAEQQAETAAQNDAAQQKDDPTPCGFAPLRDARAALAIKAVKLRRLRLLRDRT